MSKQEQEMSAEAMFRHYLGDDFVTAMKDLGIINGKQPFMDPRQLAHRPTGDPDIEFSELVFRLAEQQGIELSGFYRDLIGEQAKRMRFLRPILMQDINRRREAREIGSIMQLQEVAIGQLLEYIAMMAIDKVTGVLKPDEFTRQMSTWVEQILVKREAPGYVVTGQFCTGVYPEDDAVLTLARIQSPEMTQHVTALSAPGEMTRVELLQAAEMHQPFRAGQPFLNQEGDPNGFLFMTQGYDLMGVDHAYQQIMAQIGIDPMLGTKPAVTAVHVAWSEAIRLAMYITGGQPFWAPNELTGRLLQVWRRLLHWEFEFYSAPELVDFLRRVYQHDPDVFARVARQMKLRMIRPTDIVRILGRQTPEQTLTTNQSGELDEFSRWVFHLHHATERQPLVDTIDYIGRFATATSRRKFEELSCLDAAAVAVHLALPYSADTDVFNLFTKEQQLRINASIEACDAMVEALGQLNVEVDLREAAVAKIDFQFVPLPEPPPALPAGPEDQYEEGEAFRDDGPPNSDEEIAMMSFSVSDDSGGDSESSSDPASDKPDTDSQGFRLLTTSDFPVQSEETVDLSDPSAKPPPRPRFKGKVPGVPLKSSMAFLETGAPIPDSVSEPTPVDDDPTAERPSHASDDDDEESSIGHDSEGYSIPPIHLGTLDEADETPPATRDISRLSQPEIKEATVEVQVESTPPPITDVAEEIVDDSIHGPESEFAVRPQGKSYVGRRLSHDFSDAEDSPGFDEDTECDASGPELSYYEVEGEPDTCEESQVDDTATEAGDSEDMAAATTEGMPGYGAEVQELPAYTEVDPGSIEESSSLGTGSVSEESSSKRRINTEDDDPSSNSGPVKT